MSGAAAPRCTFGQQAVPCSLTSAGCSAGAAVGTVIKVIHEVDIALRSLIEREATDGTEVEVVFDAPTKDWASRRNVPTIDVYLYDIREDLRRRERGLINEYDERDRITTRHLPPRHFKLSYLVTAWTQRPEDEHRLLSALLSCFLRHDAIPADLVTGPLAELGLAGPGDGRAAAARGPLVRRRVVGPGRRAQAVAGRCGQRADAHRAAVRGRSAGDQPAAGLAGRCRRLAAAGGAAAGNGGAVLRPAGEERGSAGGVRRRRARAGSG